MPHKKHYGYNTMKGEKREEFLKWYDEQVRTHNHFDMKKEIAEYCHSDVDILRRGCMEFRKAFLEFCIDPFRYTTIASCVMTLYLGKFMPENSIAVLKNEKQNRMTSRACIEWLAFRSRLDNTNIQHAFNGGEKMFYLGQSKAYVDGWDEKNKIAYEFYGCHWHGCQKCYDSNLINIKKNKTMGALYKETKVREALLSEKVSNIITIWECEWRLAKTSEILAEDTNELITEEEKLEPRESMFGGRTNALTLYWKSRHESEYANYIDVSGLHPAVMYYDPYPTGHHEIIHPKNENERKQLALNIINKVYFGIVKAKMLPPKKLIHPVLPKSDRGKMMYYLCDKCGMTGYHGVCNHSDNERALTGTWATPEIYKALDKGYKLMKVYEVWAEQSESLFKEYIKTFIKVKQESSGYPKGCITDEDKENYINNMEIKMGVRMDKDKIEKNSGRRAVAKLCLNSLCGKFGQKQNKPQTKFIREKRIYTNL